MQTKTLFSLENSPIPLLIIEEKGKIITSSKVINTFFEYRSDVQINSIHDLLGDLSLNFKNKIKNKEQFSEVYEVISKDGSLRWIKLSLFPIVTDKNLFQICFHDISREKLKYDLDQKAKKIAKIGSWSVNLIENSLYWSEETKAIHEVPNNFIPDLETGINFYKEGKSRDLIIEAVSECIESGQGYDLELVIITAKGNEKWVRAIGNAERFNGKTIGFSGVFQDIDDAKRQRGEYDELNDRLRAAVDSANVGVWDFNIIENTLFWDERMYDLYGVNKADFEGVYDAWERTIHPDDKEKAAFEVEQAIKGKMELDTEFRIIKQDGTIAYIHAEAKVFHNKKGEPYRLIGANTDVTRIKRRDDRLRKLLNVTEKQNQRLLDFTNIVSHNLRSNSSNISMLSGMLNSNLPADRQKKFIEMIQTSSERLDETIVQLNEIVKIQATDSREINQINVKQIFNKVLESINGLVLESSARIHLKVDDNLKVNAVKPYLTSVFMNLLTNSIKYRKPNKQLKIEIKAKALPNQTVISFIDNGIGIDLNKNGSKIFGMYKTFHNNKDAKGIGLFITKNHMEAMDGKIQVESKLNEGSIFHLYFSNDI